MNAEDVRRAQEIIQRLAQLTTEPITVPGPATTRPEWIRLPATNKADPVTGLKRSFLNHLILPSRANGYKPPVRSVALRRPGNVRGVRLIHLASLLEFIAEQERTARNVRFCRDE